MRIHRLGRKLYAALVTLDPPATGTWQASFDGGTTWINGTARSDGSFEWLVKGPDNNDTGHPAVFAIPANTKSVSVLLRLQPGSEDIIVHGPTIDVDD